MMTDASRFAGGPISGDGIWLDDRVQEYAEQGLLENYDLESDEINISLTVYEGESIRSPLSRDPEDGDV